MSADATVTDRTQPIDVIVSCYWCSKRLALAVRPDHKCNPKYKDRELRLEIEWSENVDLW